MCCEQQELQCCAWGAWSFPVPCWDCCAEDTAEAGREALFPAVPAIHWILQIEPRCW